MYKFITRLMFYIMSYFSNIIYYILNDIQGYIFIKDSSFLSALLLY